MDLVKADHVGLLEILAEFYGATLQDPSKESMSSALSQVAATLGADIVGLFLVSPDRLSLRLAGLYADGQDVTRSVTIESPTNERNELFGSSARSLIAQVAVSGKPVFVASADELVALGGAERLGGWHSSIFPEGVNDAKSGLRCLYGTPLFVPATKESVDTSVTGVLQIGRRQSRATAFSDVECRASGMIAQALALAHVHARTLRSRLLADVGHGLLDPLGNIALALDVVAEDLPDGHSYEKGQLIAASIKVRNVCSAVKIAARAVGDPTGPMTGDLQEVLDLQLGAFGLRTSNRGVVDMVGAPDQLTNAELSAFIDIIQTVLDHIARRGSGQTVSVSWTVRDGSAIVHVRSATDARADQPSRPENPERLTDAEVEAAQKLALAFGWDLTLLEAREASDVEVEVRLGKT